MEKPALVFGVPLFLTVVTFFAGVRSRVVVIVLFDEGFGESTECLSFGIGRSVVSHYL
jgi:hypothetical protein